MDIGSILALLLFGITVLLPIAVFTLVVKLYFRVRRLERERERERKREFS